MIALLLLGLGCTHNRVDPAPPLIVDVAPSRDRRILELERNADVNLYLTRKHAGLGSNYPIEFDLRQNGSRERVTVPESQLAHALSDLTVPKKLVVVQIPFILVYTWSDAELAAKVDQIEAVLKDQGFLHIAFHLAGGSFSTNYRETTVIQPNR